MALFARARYGLWMGARALGLKAGDEILVPAYHHGSEIESLLRAGLSCRFYDISEGLQAEEDELEARMGPRTRGLYLIHYFGFPQDVVHWRAWCDARGLVLFEDVALSWLATADDTPLGAFGDVSIFCLYKTLGLRDGAAVLAPHSAPADAGPQRLRPWSLLRLHMRWLERRHSWAGGMSSGLAWLARQKRATVSEMEFSFEGAGAPPSGGTTFLLPRLANRGVAARRRANYLLLLDELRDYVPPPFSELPPGAAPLVFALDAEGADDTVVRLQRHGIEASRFWPIIHPAFPPDEYPQARRWRSQLLALPVHQELELNDLERIVTAVRGRPGRRRAVTVEEFERLETVRDEWRELANNTRNIFATWEWSSTWWRHFGKNHRLVLRVCRRGENVVAILPLYLSTIGPLTALRFVGHGDSDQLGPICAPGDVTTAATALRRVLADRRENWQIFLGDSLPGDVGWSALLGARLVKRAESPLVRLRATTWDEFLGSLSPRLRHEIRHDERKLAREHDVRVRLADDVASLERDLDELFTLHHLRWGNSLFYEGQAFHRDFARCAFDRGWLRLWLLEVDGRSVAAWYGFRFNGIESHYQVGRDPAWQRSSVGLVLIAHSLRAALADGMEEYRFLRGGESYKYRFATDDPGLETVARSRGIVARAAISAKTLRSYRHARQNLLVDGRGVTTGSSRYC